MSFGRYLVGIALLAVAVGPAAVAARASRKRMLARWSGLSVVLAEVVLVLATVTFVAEVLGAAHALTAAPLAFGCAAASAAVLAAARRSSTRVPAAAAHGPRQSPDAARPMVRTVAAAALVAVAILWASGTAAGLDRGSVNVDSLWYHLPFAARFAQTGSTTALPFVQADPLSVFPAQHRTVLDPAGFPSLYPAGSSLLHASGIVLFSRDVLSPLLNLGFFVLAILAAVVLGDTAGVGLASGAAVAAVLAVPALAGTQPGEATNDVMGLSLFLAAAALLATSREPTAIALAGLAAGLALGMKLTFLIPVAALTVALLVLCRRRLIRTALLWLLPLAAVGGFWFARNLAATGSPLPLVKLGIGPLAFPRAHLPAVSRYGQSLLDHIFDSSLWSSRFLPGLHEQLGPVWPVLIAVAATGMIVALVRGRRSAERALGAVGLAAVVGYVVTPQSAGGAAGELFTYNVRFLTPALVLGVALLPITSWLRGPRRELVVVSGLALMAIVEVIDTRPWPTGARGTVLATLFVVGAGAATIARPRIGRRPALVAVLTIAVAGVGVSWLVARHYLAGRYARGGGYEHVAAGPAAMYQWARGLHDTRVGVEGFVAQYPLYGTDISNRVAYVGRRGAHGAFLPAPSCASWRTLLAAGRYRYVITAPYNFPYNPAAPAPPEAAWTRSDPHAREVARFAGGAVAFRLLAPPDPRSCAYR